MWWLLLLGVFVLSGKKSGPIGAGVNPPAGGGATGVGYDPTGVTGSNPDTPPILGTGYAKADGSQTPPYDGTGGTTLSPGTGSRFAAIQQSTDYKGAAPPSSSGAYLRNVPGAKA